MVLWRRISPQRIYTRGDSEMCVLRSTARIFLSLLQINLFILELNIKKDLNYGVKEIGNRLDWTEESDKNKALFEDTPRIKKLRISYSSNVTQYFNGDKFEHVYKIGNFYRSMKADRRDWFVTVRIYVNLYN